MKPAWDKLKSTYAGSPTVVVADVDCTAEAAKAVCEDQGVRGYPTIKYFNETNSPQGTKYEGGRDPKTLKKFVKKTLGGIPRNCDVVSKSGCFPEEVEVFERWEGKTPGERKAELKRLEKQLGGALKADARTAMEKEARGLKVLIKADAPDKEL